MEKIIRIEESSFKKKSSQDEYDGYLIFTDKQTIKFGISNSQSCCEDFGYFHTEDSINDFVGAEIIEICTTDTALNTEKFNKEMEDVYMEECSCMFLTIKTTKGDLQFVTYNSHNGCYGHEAVVISSQLNEIEYL